MLLSRENFVELIQQELSALLKRCYLPYHSSNKNNTPEFLLLTLTVIMYASTAVPLL